MNRECKDCPEDVKAICRYVFGKYWNDKSHDGRGCNHPVDGIAEAWRKAGWRPSPPTGAETKVCVPFPGGVAVLSRPAQDGPPKMPRRPKVSARILKQAELFFGGQP